MPCKLLLVDDSVTIRRVVELTFAGEDVAVVAMGDGREAMERIVSEQPDIVLADVGPGEPDGYEVAAFVKRHPALAHVPVVLLTGAFQPVDQARAVECGCDGVLAKPFDLQSMVSLVRDLLHAPAAARPPATAGRDPDRSGLPKAGDAVSAPPAAARDAEDLLDWWATLLEEAEPQQPPLPNAAPAEAAAGDAVLSLDDYFDLVDEVLARSGEASGTAPAGSGLPQFRG